MIACHDQEWKIMRGSWIKLKVIPGLCVDSKLKGEKVKRVPQFIDVTVIRVCPAQEQTDGIFFLTLELK